MKLTKIDLITDGYFLSGTSDDNLQDFLFNIREWFIEKASENEVSRKHFLTPNGAIRGDIISEQDLPNDTLFFAFKSKIFEGFHDLKKDTLNQIKKRIEK